MFGFCAKNKLYLFFYILYRLTSIFEPPIKYNSTLHSPFSLTTSCTYRPHDELFSIAGSYQTYVSATLHPK